MKTKQFVIDGEAVLLGVDGISDFDGLYAGKKGCLHVSNGTYACRLTGVAALRLYLPYIFFVALGAS